VPIPRARRALEAIEIAAQDGREPAQHGTSVRGVVAFQQERAVRPRRRP
jgi:hypothetical protein